MKAASITRFTPAKVTSVRLNLEDKRRIAVLVKSGLAKDATDAIRKGLVALTDRAEAA